MTVNFKSWNANELDRGIEIKRIVHISDIHFSETYYMPEIANSMLENINRSYPDIVVITGDLTENGLAIIKEPSYWETGTSTGIINVQKDLNIRFWIVSGLSCEINSNSLSSWIHNQDS